MKSENSSPVFEAYCIYSNPSITKVIKCLLFPKSSLISKKKQTIQIKSDNQDFTFDVFFFKMKVKIPARYLMLTVFIPAHQLLKSENKCLLPKKVANFLKRNKQFRSN